MCRQLSPSSNAGDRHGERKTDSHALSWVNIHSFRDARAHMHAHAHTRTHRHILSQENIQQKTWQANSVFSFEKEGTDRPLPTSNILNDEIKNLNDDLKYKSNFVYAYTNITQIAMMTTIDQISHILDNKKNSVDDELIFASNKINNYLIYTSNDFKTKINIIDNNLISTSNLERRVPTAESKGLCMYSCGWLTRRKKDTLARFVSVQSTSSSRGNDAGARKNTYTHTHARTHTHITHISLTKKTQKIAGPLWVGRPKLASS